MKIYPFDLAVADACSWIEQGYTVLQQFNCAACGEKQTIAEENRFFTSGICEECGHETDIRRNGCNWMLIASSAP